MKILKRVLLVIAIIIAIPLIIALFVNKEYHVERGITIAKPKQQVFDYVKSLKNQNKFSKWANIDPNMKSEFRGTDGTVGSVSHWSSEDGGVGEGEQEIVGIKEGERIDYELRFIRPMESTAGAYMTTEDAGGNTLVKWGFHGNSPYPMNFMNLFMEGMIGNDLETGLTNLKNIMEK